jgi:hypothetical protein
MVCAFLKCTRVLLLMVVLVVVGACTGESGPTRPEADGGVTGQTGGGGGGGTASDPECSATGVSASCDPVDGTGCGSGASCYLVRNQGPSCVCPGGAAQEGEACNTTTECKAQLVCAGTQAPGVCRRTCDPSASDCLSGTFCRFITAFPTFGYCEEQ